MENFLNTSHKISNNTHTDGFYIKNNFQKSSNSNSGAVITSSTPTQSTSE
jgi:hypothetical protein